MDSNLIVVKQLPIIEDQLRQLKDSIKQRVEHAKAMVCTEDTRQVVKAERAALNKEFKELEARRKQVKAEVLAPYEAFELVYRECTDAYKFADADLKAKIDAVEFEMKETKTAEIECYFDEVCEGLNIPDGLVSLDRTKIKVNLSSSISKLKQQVYDFLNKVAGELKYISGLEYSEEILVEYRKSLDVILAADTVADRHRCIEEERQRKQAEVEKQAAREAAVEQVELAVQEQIEQEEALQPPTPENIPVQVQQSVSKETYADTPEKKMGVASFRVIGTMEQLKALAIFLNEGGYDYETI